MANVLWDQELAFKPSSNQSDPGFSCFYCGSPTSNKASTGWLNRSFVIRFLDNVGYCVSASSMRPSKDSELIGKGAKTATTCTRKTKHAGSFLGQGLSSHLLSREMCGPTFF